MILSFATSALKLSRNSSSKLPAEGRRAVDPSQENFLSRFSQIEDKAWSGSTRDAIIMRWTPKRVTTHIDSSGSYPRRENARVRGKNKSSDPYLRSLSRGRSTMTTAPDSGARYAAIEAAAVRSPHVNRSRARTAQERSGISTRRSWAILAGRTFYSDEGLQAANDSYSKPCPVVGRQEASGCTYAVTDLGRAGSEESGNDCILECMECTLSPNMQGSMELL
ncbi:hypothetical protein EVAR_7652_1 [Eumeta japonica]|uniref:Uncharacterized protein n=1 Tax=Eumeta variegata TaxID=151549 RepID=A0A4C1TLA6_EUMVA|nr:hypothetical protein EVAR_7652_1 [Eumeta japonica]